ncbi:MAG: transposase, partial [Methylobacter sp.]|nr:transposase [Methylobacter sp.]
MVIKRKFSAGLPSRVVGDSKTKKREKGVWQRRFWEHCIRDENDWRQHVDYIHFNPVKHGYVSAPQDWLYSSFNQAVSKGWYEPGVLLEDDFKDIDKE